MRHQSNPLYNNIRADRLVLDSAAPADPPPWCAREIAPGRGEASPRRGATRPERRVVPRVVREPFESHRQEVRMGTEEPMVNPYMVIHGMINHPSQDYLSMVIIHGHYPTMMVNP